MSSSGPARERSPRASGDAVEAAVVQALPLRAVTDVVATHYDAVATRALWSDDVPMTGVLVVEDGAHVEIKGCQRTLATGKRGRFYLRRGQLETLADEGAVILFAVYQPGRYHELLAMRVAPAVQVLDLVADLGGWLDPGDGRGRDGSQQYKQVTWSNVIAADAVQPGERRS